MSEEQESRIVYTDGPVVQNLLSALQAVEAQAREVARTTTVELREMMKELGEVRIKVSSIEAKMDANAGQGQRVGQLEQQVSALTAVQQANRWWISALTAVVAVLVAYLAAHAH